MKIVVTKTTEPGYYEDGEFGVRIENLVLIKQTKTKYSPKGTPFLTMEPITLVITNNHVTLILCSLQVPIQQKMIMFELLNEKEVGVARACAGL